MADVTLKVDGAAALDAYVAKLQYLTSGAWREPLYERIGGRLYDLVMEGWDNEADPAGNPWAPTTRSNPILDDTGAMRGSASHEVSADGITLTIADFKAAFHQYGTSRGLVPRRMLPDGDLPAAWTAVIQEEATAFFAELFGG